MFEKVREILVEQLGVSEDKVTLEANNHHISGTGEWNDPYWVFMTKEIRTYVIVNNFV